MLYRVSDLPIRVNTVLKTTVLESSMLSGYRNGVDHSDSVVLCVHQVMKSSSHSTL